MFVCKVKQKKRKCQTFFVNLYRPYRLIMRTIAIQYYDSPCGTLVLGSIAARLCLCDWTANRHRERTDARLQRTLNAEYAIRPSDVVSRAMSELDEYFLGKRTAFDIPLLMAGTEFQKQVWQSLLAIPYGTTISYGEEARRIGMPAAVRAVANANGANPISILVPCHRVIGSNGALTGYGGGTVAKQWLLQLELSGKIVPTQRPIP